MRGVRMLARLFFGLFLIGWIASAVAAAYARGRISSRGDEGDDDFELVSIYAGHDFVSRAPALRRASVLSWYGGGTVDLRGATLDPAGAVLAARSVFGGIRLVVPESWPIERNAIGIFGGIGDARDPARVDWSLPSLRLDAWSLFGGIGIVGEAPDLDEKAAEEAEVRAASEAGLASEDQAVFDGPGSATESETDATSEPATV